MNQHKALHQYHIRGEWFRLQIGFDYLRVVSMVLDNNIK